MFDEVVGRLKDKKYAFFTARMKDGSDPFETITVNERENSRVIILYGENASGKSLFATVIEQYLREKKIACRAAAMRNRTGGGIEVAFVFGDERRQSTGATSVSVADKALTTTAKEEKAAVAILDEPDLGLSSYYSRAFGKYVAESIAAMDDNKGLILISHSPTLIGSFLDNNEVPVTTIGINTDNSLEDWIKKEDCASIEELLNLSNYGHEKEVAITRAISDN